MPFQQLEPPAPTSGPPTVKAFVNGKGLNLSLAEAVWRKIGFDPERPLGVLAGTGDDAGKIRLIETKDGAFRWRKAVRSSVRLCVGWIEGIDADPCKARPCEWEMVDGKKGCVEVTLPEVIMADPPAPRPVVGAVSSRDVTADLLGDPKRARR